MMGIVKEHVGEQSRSGYSAKKWSVNGFHPIVVSTGFYEIPQHLIPLLNQPLAVADIVMIAAIGLTYRRIF